MFYSKLLSVLFVLLITVNISACGGVTDREHYNIVDLSKKSPGFERYNIGGEDYRYVYIDNDDAIINEYNDTPLSINKNYNYVYSESFAKQNNLPIKDSSLDPYGVVGYVEIIVDKNSSSRRSEPGPSCNINFLYESSKALGFNLRDTYDLDTEVMNDINHLRALRVSVSFDNSSRVNNVRFAIDGQNFSQPVRAFHASEVVSGYNYLAISMPCFVIHQTLEQYPINSSVLMFKIGTSPYYLNIPSQLVQQIFKH